MESIINNEVPRVDVVYDWRGKADEYTPAYVYVRVYYNRKDRRYVNTGVKVLPQHWSEKFWVVRRKDAIQLNNEIQDQVRKCVELVQAAVKENRKVCGDVLTTMREEEPFLKWLKKRIETSKLAKSSKVQNLTMLKNVEEFGKMKRWEEVRGENLRAWIDCLRTRGIDDVTVYSYWKRLRKWLNVAIREDLLPMGCYHSVYVPRGKYKQRVFLTDDEMKAFMKYEPVGLHLRKARDLFVVQMGCGLAYADLMSVDFKKHQKMGAYETLQGRRVKTEEQYFLVIMPWAVKILEQWEWELPRISNQKYNDYVSTVASLAGIDKHVTSHVARHTYACYSLRHGIRIEAVQRTLGHADIKTTQIYARLADMDVVEAFEKLV